jgi:TolB-like protein/predicted Ser/Thr protein kinase
MLGAGDALLSTEILPSRSGVDPHPSVCWTRGVEVERALESAHAVASDNLAIGQMLSRRYRIEGELGEGGMGLVYLVRDEQVAGETFAVKVLKQGLDPEALSLLREEVRKTRKLSHPNIVDVHSVNVDGAALYVLMEYLEGKSLDALLDEEFGRGMPFSHAWPIIEDVGAALGYAHDHNVIHSDLKPANVLVTTSGRTKLLDFGIARLSRGPLLHKWSGPRAFTPTYASCEMLEGKEADPRDDIYSFACVIYEMLCGERPFGHLNALEAREAGAQVPPLEGLSRTQNELLAQGLAFEREARIASVEQLLAGLAPDRGPGGRQNAVLGFAVATVAALSLTYLAVDKPWIYKRSVVVQPVASEAQKVAFAPPPHSVAVLPFVNLSGDKEQEYFSDGLTEELLNSLSRIDELQVAARTSSFYFKDKGADLPTIANKLNVASLLEGSVRRSGNTIRITAQLNNAVTGFHLWSQTYDRGIGDVLQLQTEIATAVAAALRVTLLSDVGAKIELGGTRNPAAFDAYVRASNGYWTLPEGQENERAVIDGFTDAIRLDPEYALAYADRSLALSSSVQGAKGPAVLDHLIKAQADARNAIALAPDLAEGHLAMAVVLQMTLDFAGATTEYERASALAPGNARVLRDYGAFAVSMGKTEVGLAAAHRGVVLDPLNPETHYWLGVSLILARRYDEAIASFTNAKSLSSNDRFIALYIDGWIGLSYYLTGNVANSRARCGKPDHFFSLICMAMRYDKLGQRAAEIILAKLRALRGENGALVYAMIYAQWGDRAKALECLDTAMRLHDPWLQYLKVFAVFDPLRKEPRFQAIERELNFPN